MKHPPPPRPPRSIATLEGDERLPERDTTILCHSCADFIAARPHHSTANETVAGGRNIEIFNPLPDDRIYFMWKEYLQCDDIRNTE